MSNSLSDKDIKTVSSIFSKIEPGPLPTEIFNQLARIMVTTTVVFVPLLYDKADRLCVLLTKRDENDTYYPNLYHPAGTVLRPTDVTIETAFNRILVSELKNPKVRNSPVFVDYVFDEIERGREVSLIHWIELLEKPEVGELFSIDCLPENIIQNDIPRIKLAVDHFLTH